MLTILLLLLFQTSSASACATGCLKCDTETNCLECDLAALYYLKGGLCVKSAARKCAQIDSNGKCIECQQGNYFFRGLVCVSVVPIDDCLSYNPRASSTTCEKCTASTILYENKCLMPIENCEAYDSETGLCIQCRRQFKLSLTWKQCLIGLIKNCDYYDTLGYCRECNLTAPRLSTRRTACLPVINGCLLHSSSQDSCVECDIGLVKSTNSKSCFAEITGCQSYDESGLTTEEIKCSACKANFLFDNSDSKSRCVNQLINCVDYNAQEKKCLHCLDNFILTSDSLICLLKVDQCKAYSPSTYHTKTLSCSECETGFRIAKDAITNIATCLQSIVGCKTYDEMNLNICSACDPMLKLSEDKRKCVAFIPNCLSYSEASTATDLICQTCVTGYQLSSNSRICIKNISDCVRHSETGNACLECSKGKLPTSDSQLCLPEIENCDTYAASNQFSTFFICQKCADKYVPILSNTRCVKAISECEELEIQGKVQCRSCHLGFRLTDDRLNCLPEIANCEQYASSDESSLNFECLQCIEGFDVLNAGQVCVQMINGCVEQNDSDLTCIKCKTGLRFTDDHLKCLPEIQGCAQYQNSTSQNEFHACKICDSNLILFSSGKSCMIPILNCVNYNSESYSCNECKEGYLMTEEADACYPPISNCASYVLPFSIDESLKCKECANKFLLNSETNFCFEVIGHCLKQNRESFKCDECEFGYALTAIGTECRPRIENCLNLAAYDPVNPNVSCEVCAESFEVRKEGAICAPIIKGCLQRDLSEFVCVSCETGLNATTDGLVCLPSVPNCKNYTPSLHTATSLSCEKCIDGYDVSNNGKSCSKIIVNCQSQNKDNQLCDACAANFILTSDKLACFAAIENCSVHQSLLSTDAVWKCQTCKDGFITFENNLKCVPEIQNCTKRNSLALCVECSTSWLPTSDGKKCLPVIPKCLQYTQDSNVSSTNLTCVACETGSVLQNNACASITVIANCDSQNQSTGTCITCAKNFVLTSDSLACLPSILNCIGYTTVISGNNRQLICSSCSAGKISTTDGLACLPEIANCNGYAPSTKSSTSLTCISCMTNYEVENNICVKIGIQDCVFYIKELDTCGFCNTDFYLTDDSKACLPDISFCVEIDPSSSSSRYLTCSTCLSSFILSDDKRKCFPRVRNCLQYAPATYQTEKLMCSKCEILYLVQPDGSCARKVISNCRQLSSTTALCTQCIPSYVATTDGERCLPEVPKCLTYAISNINTKQLTCLKCVDGATLTQDNICYDGTIPYCTNYDAVAKVCNGCDFGKVVTTDKLKCLDPIFNCDIYAPSAVTSISSSCQTCKPGFQPFFDGKVCGYKVSGCAQYDNTTLTCKACSTDTHPSTDGRLCLANVPLCQVYDLATIDNPLVKCLQCNLGYMIDTQTNTCIPKVISFCITVDLVTGLCSECKSGYRLTDDKELCLEEVSNCKLYMESSKFSSIFQCIQCRPGYQMIALSCIPKPIPFCEERDPQTGLCKLCIEGKRVTDDGEICLDEIENCAQYAPSSKTTEEFTCIGCEQNSFFMNGNCVQTINNCLLYNDRYFYCDECQSKFNVTTDGEKCLSSVDHCDYYAFSTAASTELQCEYCANGYTPSNQGRVCSPVISQPNTQPSSTTTGQGGSSSTVSPTNQTVTCEMGWQLTDDGKRCLPQIDNCLIYEPTTQISLQNVCLRCKDGFTLGLNGEVCLA